MRMSQNAQPVVKLGTALGNQKQSNQGEIGPFNCSFGPQPTLVFPFWREFSEHTEHWTLDYFSFYQTNSSVNPGCSNGQCEKNQKTKKTKCQTMAPGCKGSMDLRTRQPPFGHNFSSHTRSGPAPRPRKVKRPLSGGRRWDVSFRSASLELSR